MNHALVEEKQAENVRSLDVGKAETLMRKTLCIG
jgi:hypothetical protein